MANNIHLRYVIRDINGYKYSTLTSLTDERNGSSWPNPTAEYQSTVKGKFVSHTSSHLGHQIAFAKFHPDLTCFHLTSDKSLASFHIKKRSEYARIVIAFVTFSVNNSAAHGHLSAWPASDKALPPDVGQCAQFRLHPHIVLGRSLSIIDFGSVRNLSRQK